MAVIRPGDIQRFIARGCRETALILLHGPDEGAVRLRGRAIAATLLGADADPMSRMEFDAETLNADPARLLDEANAIAMFGGKRLIVVNGAGKLAKQAWTPLLDVPPLDSTVIFLADELAKSAPLRVAMEASAQAAAIPCYAPSQQDVAEIIDQRVRAAGLTITPVARAYLAELLGSDLALTENEIDKVVLHAQGQLAIDVADIDVLVTDSSDLAATEPIDRAFDGKLDEIEAVATRSFREGINPSGLLALALNHAMMLRRLAVARGEGSLDAAFRGERLFFRRADRVRAQAQTWTLEPITRAIGILAAAQEQTRRAPGIEETVTVRALWAIALASRRR